MLTNEQEPTDFKPSEIDPITKQPYPVCRGCGKRHAMGKAPSLSPPSGMKPVPGIPMKLDYKAKVAVGLGLTLLFLNAIACAGLLYLLYNKLPLK